MPRAYAAKEGRTKCLAKQTEMSPACRLSSARKWAKLDLAPHQQSKHNRFPLPPSSSQDKPWNSSTPFFIPSNKGRSSRNGFCRIVLGNLILAEYGCTQKPCLETRTKDVRANSRGKVIVGLLADKTDSIFAGRVLGRVLDPHYILFTQKNMNDSVGNLINE